MRAEPPVMAAEVAGSVSERDLLELLFRARLIDRVEDHMSPPLPCIGSGESVETVVSALVEADAVLVHVDGAPTGVLTRHDLLGRIADD